jgi:hypothetical protein
MVNVAMLMVMVVAMVMVVVMLEFLPLCCFSPKDLRQLREHALCEQVILGLDGACLHYNAPVVSDGDVNGIFHGAQQLGLRGVNVLFTWYHVAVRFLMMAVYLIKPHLWQRHTCVPMLSTRSQFQR